MQGSTEEEEAKSSVLVTLSILPLSSRRCSLSCPPALRTGSSTLLFLPQGHSGDSGRDLLQRSE